MACPGIGDYADANGNTHQVMSDGHVIRDHGLNRTSPAIEDTGETFDCVVVGGGISGLAAALFYKRAAGPKAILPGAGESSDLWGARPKRNEFSVDGQRLIASQGSADVVPAPAGKFFSSTFTIRWEIDPRGFSISAEIPARSKIGVTPYAGDGSNFGFFLRRQTQTHPKWHVAGRSMGKETAGAHR